MSSSPPSTFVRREGDSSSNGNSPPKKTSNRNRAGYGKYASWKDRFEQLKEYKKEHGHCGVPASVPLLGRWVTCQRQERRRNRLSKERIAALNAIGFLWCGFPRVRTAQEMGLLGSKNSSDNDETESVAVSYDEYQGLYDNAGTTGQAGKAGKPAVVKLKNRSYIQQQEDEYQYLQGKSQRNKRLERDNSDEKEEDEGAVPSKLQLLHKLVMTQEKMQLQSEKIQQLQNEKIQQLEREKIQQLQGNDNRRRKKVLYRPRNRRHRKDDSDEEGEGDDSDEDEYKETVPPKRKEREPSRLKEPHSKKRCRRDGSDEKMEQEINGSEGKNAGDDGQDQLRTEIEIVKAANTEQGATIEENQATIEEEDNGTVVPAHKEGEPGHLKEPHSKKPHGRDDSDEKLEQEIKGSEGKNAGDDGQDQLRTEVEFVKAANTEQGATIAENQATIEEEDNGTVGTTEKEKEPGHMKEPPSKKPQGRDDSDKKMEQEIKGSEGSAGGAGGDDNQDQMRTETEIEIVKATNAEHEATIAEHKATIAALRAKIQENNSQGSAP